MNDDIKLVQASLFIYLIYKQSNHICPHCHALQSKENIHCIHCGTRINQICDSCNSIIEQEDTFCRHCGKEIRKSRNSNQ